MRSRGGLLVALALSAVIATGCGGGDGDGDQEAIAAVLDQLRSTQDAGDAETACSEVYVIQEAERGAQAEGEDGGEADAGEAEAQSGEPATEGGGEAEGGEEGGGPAECEDAFRAADARRRAEVHDLTTRVGSIEVDGDRATAIVHTELHRDDGSFLSQDVPYDLVRTAGGWRIRIADEG